MACATCAEPLNPRRQALPIDGLLGSLQAALTPGSTLLLQAPPGAGKTTRVPLALREHLDASGLSDGRLWILRGEVCIPKSSLKPCVGWKILRVFRQERHRVALFLVRYVHARKVEHCCQVARILFERLLKEGLSLFKVTCLDRDNSLLV